MLVEVDIPAHQYGQPQAGDTAYGCTHLHGNHRMITSCPQQANDQHHTLCDDVI